MMAGSSSQMDGLIPKALNPFKKSKGYSKKDVAEAAYQQIKATPQGMDPNRLVLLGLGAAGLFLLFAKPKGARR